MDVIDRETLERREHELLSPWACHSDESSGRVREETPDPLRTCFQCDRDRILHSKSFRRLANKTQVFLAPEGDHYRTRLTHTLEVVQIACAIALPLGLNVDLTEAIALGHDLGHTPFGHCGERALQRAMARRLHCGPDDPRLFHHNEQSARIVCLLEKDGRGLNLTREVIDGIVNHNQGTAAHTLEGQVVARADRMAYVTHDMDDAKRAGILSEESLPVDLRNILGSSSSERIETMVHDAVGASAQRSEIAMSDVVWDAMMRMRGFLFQNLYSRGEAKREEPKAAHLVEELFAHFVCHPYEMPAEYRSHEEDSVDVQAADYVSSMTDRYAIRLYEQLNVPKAWSLSDQRPGG